MFGYSVRKQHIKFVVERSILQIIAHIQKQHVYKFIIELDIKS